VDEKLKKDEKIRKAQGTGRDNLSLMPEDRAVGV